MKQILIKFALLFMFSIPFFAQTTYNDSAGDIDPGLANGDGTLDILKMEVSQTATDFIFQLTLNGNISTTDWGKFMIGIATGNSAGTATGNGWGRPINLDGASGDMNYWIGCWVDAGGGAQLWSYSGGTWSGPSALAGYSMAAGDTSTLTYTVSYASIGITDPGTLYFDAYSSGGGGTDTAIDALANPNVAVTSWSESYTSNVTNGLLSYSFGALPVELTSFTAAVTENNVTLNWQTATEVNNYGFEIERTIKNSKFEIINWERIGFVDGCGNSNSVKEYRFIDKDISKGIYCYRLKQIDIDGSFSYSKEVMVKSEVEEMPLVFELFQNYPNPFNPSTTIKFGLPQDSHVTLEVFNILGEKVATLINKEMKLGFHQVKFNSTNLTSGIYVYRINAGEFVHSKKLMILK